jgi:hypothetical protein
MTETTSKPSNGERYKFLVVVLTVFTTIVTAIVASLQADANIRAASNNNASQQYAIQASGELQRQGLQSGYDFNLLTGYLKDAQEAIVYQMTALEQETSGDIQGAASSRLKAEIAQARADKARQLSIFFNDPRYAPETEEGIPDAEAYLADSFSLANDLVARQNTTADEYNHWNNKADSYAGVLTILAVAFFQFGLAQALSPRLRLLFALFGTVTLAGSMVWTLIVLIM